MPVVAPGGQIIGGMGGRIWVGPLGLDENQFTGLSGQFNADVGQNPPSSLDVAEWRIFRQFINAECPHSGTYGAITRRTVAFDWFFAAALEQYAR